MSFFKKLAASAGIGAAKVETILEKDAYYPGEEVRGDFSWIKCRCDLLV